MEWPYLYSSVRISSFAFHPFTPIESVPWLYVPLTYLWGTTHSWGNSKEAMLVLLQSQGWVYIWNICQTNRACLHSTVHHCVDIRASWRTKKVCRTTDMWYCHISLVCCLGKLARVFISLGRVQHDMAILADKLLSPNRTTPSCTDMIRLFESMVWQGRCTCHAYKLTRDAAMLPATADKDIDIWH